MYDFLISAVTTNFTQWQSSAESRAAFNKHTLGMTNARRVNAMQKLHPCQGSINHSCCLLEVTSRSQDALKYFRGKPKSAERTHGVSSEIPEIAQN